MDADERWIEDRLSSPTGSADDMRAAIARGREQGRAEVMPEVERLRREAADDYQNVMAPLVDMLGKAVQATHFAWSGHALDAARVLIADRDRLAKRCEELEATTLALSAARAPDQKRISELSQRCAEPDEVVKVLRREGQLLRDIGELSRLAALEQRVGALVEALRDTVHGHDGLGEPLRTRLAALRSLGVAKPDLDARDLRNLRDSYKGIAQALADAEIEPGHSQPDSVRLLVAALATARRERDEAGENAANAALADAETIETCRETISRQREMIAARDAEIAGLKAKLAEAERAVDETLKERDDLHDLLDEFAACVASEDVIGEHTNANNPWRNAMAMVDTLRALVAGKVGLPMRGANGMSVGDRVHYRIDGRCGVAEDFLHDGDADVRFDDGTTATVHWCHLEPERAAIATLRASLTEVQGEVADVRERCDFREKERDEARAERDTLRARIAELAARGLIERAVEALAQWHGPWRGAITVESLEDLTEPLLADLRAYLGGG